MKYQHILRNLLEMIDRNIPILCFRCRKLLLKKWAITRLHRPRGWVQLCRECDDELYKPFKEE